MQLTSMGPMDRPLSPHEQARSYFIDAAAELVATARQAGVLLTEIQADFDGLVSIQVPDATDDWVTDLEIPSNPEWCSRAWHDGICCMGSWKEWNLL